MLCRRQLGQLQGRIGDFQKAGVTLWAISADPLPTSRDLQQRLGLTFPLGADPDLRVIRAFGVEMADQPISLPATFVLARGTGEIVFRYVGETAFDRPRIDALLRAARGPGGP
jgi:glutaredoxin-dependent peroxiredoxin